MEIKLFISHWIATIAIVNKTDGPNLTGLVMVLRAKLKASEKKQKQATEVS